MRTLLRRLARDDRGAVTIEFVLWFPLFFGLVLTSVESGMLMLRYVMLERGLDVTVRELRVGNLVAPTHDQLKARICEESLIIPDCAESLTAELRPVSTTTWAMPTQRVACVDRSEEVQPLVEVTPGSANELMLIRVCAKFAPIIPTSTLGLALHKDNFGNYALVSTSAFVNEPG